MILLQTIAGGVSTEKIYENLKDALTELKKHKNKFAAVVDYDKKTVYVNKIKPEHEIFNDFRVVQA